MAYGFLSYAGNLEENLRHSAKFVDKILRAANPADLPVEQPTKFELAINAKAADALGISVPLHIMLRADDARLSMHELDLVAGAAVDCA